MSAVIATVGTLAERAAARNSAEDGLFWRTRTSSEGFFFRRNNAPDSSSNYDVIIVSGKIKLVMMAPDEETDNEWLKSKRRYLAPDYVVKLEKPDTVLYTVESMVPKYHAELGMIQAYVGFLLSAAAIVAGLLVALLCGYGWWSPLIGLATGAAMFVYRFFLRDHLWTMIAALRAALYVWSRVVFRAASRAHYKDIVAHLAESENRDLARVHTIVRRLV